MSDEANFEMLLECYLSGQMTERQWQEHLQYDVGLKEWHDKYHSDKRSLYLEKFEKLKETGTI